MIGIPPIFIGSFSSWPLSLCSFFGASALWWFVQCGCPEANSYLITTNADWWSRRFLPAKQTISLDKMSYALLKPWTTWRWPKLAVPKYGLKYGTNMSQSIFSWRSPIDFPWQWMRMLIETPWTPCLLLNKTTPEDPVKTCSARPLPRALQHFRPGP